MIWYLPIEHEEMRYTKHLDTAICQYLMANHNPKDRQEWIRLSPDFPSYDKPLPEGQFLNAPKTIAFKTRQLDRLAYEYSVDGVQDGDIIFLSDIWFPGIEAIRYLDFFCNKKVRLHGILHAGSFTDTDFVRQLERWAAMIENAWFDMFDRVIVASHFIKKEVCSRRLLDPKKVVVSSFPLDPRAVRPDGPRENIVIFNGRLCDEKQPEMFSHLMNKMVEDDHVPFGTEWISTQAAGLAKNDYFNLLKRAKCVVSFALQENFGFGIAEATMCGCLPVVPDRLVYPELYPLSCLYRNIDECAAKVKLAVKKYSEQQSKSVINFLSKRIKSDMSKWFIP